MTETIDRNYLEIKSIDALKEGALPKIIHSIDGTKSNFNEIKKIITKKDNIIFLGSGFSSTIAEEFKNFIEKNE